MIKRVCLLVSIGILFAVLNPVTAQDDVHATVNYPSVNLRDAPNPETATHWTGTSNIVAVLSQGEAVIVQAVETIDRYDSDYGYTWVYVTVPARNVAGWIAGEYLTFEQANWYWVVPHLRNWKELVHYVGERLPEAGIKGKIANPCGHGNYFYPLVDDPINQNLVVQIPIDTPIMIYGRAEIDGEPSYFLYIMSLDGQYEGWIDINYIGEVVYTTGCGAPPIDYFNALPILYSGTTDSRTLHPYGVVEITAVNLRSAPGTDSEILRELPYQTHLTLHSITGYKKDEAWVYVTVASTGESGWVFAKYLSYWITNWRGSHQSDNYIRGLPLSEQ